MDDVEISLRNRRPWLDNLMAGVGIALLIAVLLGSVMLAHGPAEMLTRNTVRLSMSWYAAALLIMIRMRPADWRAASDLGRLARWCWTWAAVAIFVHFVMAFTFYHDWSHQRAYEVTREQSGVGEGIYSLYFFVGLWVADALWWWIRPEAYASRSVWIDRTLHAFMLFIAFNGMIVFAHGPIRWAGIVMYVALPAAWIAWRGLSGASERVFKE